MTGGRRSSGNPIRCGAPASWGVESPTKYALGYVAAVTPTVTRPGAPIPTASCESNYTIQTSDSWQSISRKKQVSTFFLTYVNRLPPYSASLPVAGTTICLPQQCPIYSVSPIDTCGMIARVRGVTTQQLISWNPMINPDCSNLRTMTNYQICAGPLGTTAHQTVRYSVPHEPMLVILS